MEKQISMMGKTVTVKDRIPYRQKAEAAEDLASLCVVFNEELGIAYDSYLHSEYTYFIMVKYYSDMDLSEYNGDGWIFDFMDALEQDAEGFDALREYARDDFDTVERLEWNLRNTVQELYNKEHSLEHRAMTSFGFLLDGKDLTETLAQARDVNEQMIDHLGAIAKANTVDLAKYAKKNK